MALEGSLTDFGLADIFQLIGLQRKTGILKLQGDSDTVSVTFENGMIVAAESQENSVEEQVIEKAQAMDFVDPGKVRQARSVQKNTNQKITEILMLSNELDRQLFQRLYKQKVLDSLYHLFRWNTGYYHFAQDETVRYDRDNFSPISTEHILMEGVRMVDEWQRIKTRFTSLDIVFTKVSKPVEREPAEKEREMPESDIFDLGFDEDDGLTKSEDSDESLEGFEKSEKIVFDLVDGNRTIRDIMKIADQGEFETAKAFFTLSENGYIKELSKKPESTATATLDTAKLVSIEEEPPAKKAPFLKDTLSIVKTIIALGVILVLVVVFKLNPLNIFTLLKGKSDTQFQLSRNALKMTNMENALQMYYATTGKLLAGLEILVEDGYSTREQIIDAWGKEYNYAVKAEGYQIISNGPDGQQGTRDDIRLEKHLKPGQKFSFYVRIPGSSE